MNSAVLLLALYLELILGPMVTMQYINTLYGPLPKNVMKRVHLMAQHQNTTLLIRQTVLLVSSTRRPKL